MNKLRSKLRDKKILLIIGAIVVIAVVGYGIYSLISLYETNANLKLTNSNLEKTLNTTQEALTMARSQNADLSQKVVDAQNTVNGFGNTVGQIASTVGDLKKLQETDPELLEKYSKIYFLNENYVPKSLSNIATSSLYIKDRVLQIHTSVKPFLERLISDALQNNLNLLVISAYRSFGTQSVLKSEYDMTYGIGANQFSAEQGYSEHQLGTAVDFTTPKVADTFSGFSKTNEYTWLENNAYKYGFILSYPEGNHYYVFEPWHWRFVGVQLATILHNENKHFYDINQRDLDQYLINIFN